MAAQNLQAAQFIATVEDAVGGVGAKNTHLLKLSHHRGTVVGDRGTHPGQHRVIVTELPGTEVQVG